MEVFVGIALAQPPRQYAGPTNHSVQPEWLAGLKKERANVLQTINFTGGVFDQIPWTQTSWMQPQMHPYDRTFYDPDTSNYTVSRYLDDVKTRYGGIDSVLLWPTYANIGIDDRNQFDLFRTMPGGLDAVTRITAEFHAAGVHVLWPYNPWDTGTRREPKSDADTFAELLKLTGGDGFNGDTMGVVPKVFWDAAVAVNYPLAFEPEGGGTDEALNWATMGWGYWEYPHIPAVDRFKFITHGKFMVNVCNRWAKDKTDDLQAAWFNGAGYETWENVWGTWNGITPRDAEAIRRIGSMSRFFGGADGDALLLSPQWEPHTTEVLYEAQVFASRWPQVDGPRTLWTLVNRGGANLTGNQLAVKPVPGARYFDCYRGSEIQPSTSPASPALPPTPVHYTKYEGDNCYTGHGGDSIDTDPVSMRAEACKARCDAHGAVGCNCIVTMGSQCWMRSQCVMADCDHGTSYTTYFKPQPTPVPPKPLPPGTVGLPFDLHAGDYGCVLQTGPEAPDAKLAPFLATMATMTTTPLSALDAEWKVMHQSLVPIAPTASYKSPPPGSVRIPATTSFKFVTSGLEIEGDDSHGVDVQFPFEDSPRRSHEHTMGVSAFYMDKYPITTTNYSSYLAATGYTPKESNYWLRNWYADWPPEVPPPPPPPPSEKTYTRYAGSNCYDGAGGKTPDPDTPVLGVTVLECQKRCDADPHCSCVTVTAPFYGAGDVDCYIRYECQPAQFQIGTDYDTYVKNATLAAARAPLPPRKPPARMKDWPVTYVSINEARNYCAWAGGRLPHAWEWQYAAQGTDGRDHPWGPDPDEKCTHCWPTFKDGITFTGPEDVTAHAPAGDSPFGVSDLAGNVWQYTDEVHDEHTRSVILRGGSNYRPSTSSWYFPNRAGEGSGFPCTTHNKYMLFDDAYERAGTVGFRCVYDAA